MCLQIVDSESLFSIKSSNYPKFIFLKLVIDFEKVTSHAKELVLIHPPPSQRYLLKMERMHYPGQPERTLDAMDRFGLEEDSAMKIKKTVLISCPSKCFREMMTELYREHCHVEIPLK